MLVTEKTTPGTGPLTPDFSGIDAAQMNTFISALQQSVDVIEDQSERIRRVLLTVDIPTAGLLLFKQVEGWIREEIPSLKRRNAIIQESDKVGWNQKPGLVPHDEQPVQ